MTRSAPARLASVAHSPVGVRCSPVHVLDQLDEDPAGAAWVDERDAVSATTGPRLLVDELHALLAQVGERVVERPDGEPEVVQSRAAARDESLDRRPLVGGLHELEVHARDLDHGLLDAVLNDVLPRDGMDPERPRVEVEGRVEVLDSDTDLVDARDVHRGPSGASSGLVCAREPGRTVATWVPGAGLLRSAEESPAERWSDVDAQDVVIVGAARTPVGRFGGALAALRAVELGAVAIRAALERSGVPSDDVDRVLVGHVLQAGTGQNPARQAAVAADIGLRAHAETLNTVCLSGMTAIAHARDLLRLGEAQLVVAGGMESMSNAPHLLDRSRTGYRYGHGTLVDVLVHDGLTCAFDACSMGEATERYQADLGIDRAVQDAWAARSHARAATATALGQAAEEIVEVEVASRSEPVRVRDDEGVRADSDEAALAALRPAFSADGTITAGNASQLSDGGAALVLTTAGVARQRGLTILGRILSSAAVAGPDPSLLHQPAEAIRRAADRVGLDAAGLDRYEINEAFASVAIASQRALGVDPERVNVLGGAIALGHPLGASGARIVGTLLNALRLAGGGRGAAALCGGGGQGAAIIVEVSA